MLHCASFVYLYVLFWYFYLISLHFPIFVIVLGYLLVQSFLICITCRSIKSFASHICLWVFLSFLSVHPGQTLWSSQSSSVLPSVDLVCLA